MSRHMHDTYGIMPVSGGGYLGPARTDGSITTQPAPLDPSQGATPPTAAPGAGSQPTPPAAGSTPLAAVGSFLDQSVFGIPVKWLLIGFAAYYFLKR